MPCRIARLFLTGTAVAPVLHTRARVASRSGGRRLHGLYGIHGEAAFLEASVADADLGDFLAATKPEAVVHLAARADVGESLRAPCRGPW